MMRILATTALSAGLAVTPAMAVNWDGDEDGVVDAEEFVAGYSSVNTFDRFDDNNDSVLSLDELGVTGDGPVFKRADRNNDGHITLEELNATSFENYDRNNDMMLDGNEMSEVEADLESAERLTEVPFEDQHGFKFGIQKN